MQPVLPVSTSWFTDMAQADAPQAAIALAYNDRDHAPRLVAKGRGLIAEDIIARAREAGVYVHESPQLVALLMQLDMDAHIPQQLYLVVAEILAGIYRLEHASPGGPRV